jgi:Flp pilus assembly protein TadD
MIDAMETQPGDDATGQQMIELTHTARTYFVDTTRLLVFALVVVTILTYQPVWHAGFIWDDQQNVTDNQLLQTLDGLQKTWVNPGALIQYYPLTYTGFWIEYHLWGLRPLGYHLVNVLLHAVNAILLGALLTRLSVPGAWLAAFIFAVHPVHVESVAWITELKNVLSGFFFLSSFIAYLRFTNGPAHRWWFYGLALFLFLCALLSKTATIVLPAAILLVLWWKQERIRWQHVLPLIPFFLAAAFMAAGTNWVEKHYGGALGPEWQMSWVERCLVAGRVVWFYAGKLIWPHPLMFIYPRWRINAAEWWQYLFPVATVVVILVLWILRKRWGKAPFVAVFFFVGALVPVPAFFNLYFMRFSYVTDHFQYLPSIGLIALTSGVAATVWRTRQSLVMVTAPVVVALGALSWQHCEIFRDNETIWRDTVAKNPSCWLAHNNLGRLLREAGNVQGAIQYYEMALQVKPDYAEAHYNLGNALTQEGRIPDAIAHYERALQIDPNYFEAHGNLAFALLQTGRVQDAISHLEQAVRINPDSTEAQFNLALAEAGQGRLDEAISHFETALRLDPNYAEAHYILGLVLAKRGQNDEAITHLQSALRLEPGSETFRRALDSLQRINAQPPPE